VKAAAATAMQEQSVNSIMLGSPLSHPDVEAIWDAAVVAIGGRVQRSELAYASSDGRGTLSIGTDHILDREDSVAQLIFHELCHGLVEGPAGWSAPDWGLCNSDDRDAVREHACLRVQINLAEPHGLRELMAPTTAYRAYHDGITGDPLASESDVAARLASQAVNRPDAQRWIEIISRALAATRASLDRLALGEVGGPPALHPVGFPFTQGRESCGSCAWRYVGGRGRSVERCRQSAGPDGNGRRTQARFRACTRWEPRVDCATCGACCREAYHSVTVGMRDPVVWKQPDLMVRNGYRFEIRREGERCAALEVRPEVSSAVARPPREAPASAGDRRFSCSIYDDRPRACRDFEAGGAHCLVARRRVGLSP
jgi:Fe-S-cluster containining protein